MPLAGFSALTIVDRSRNCLGPCLGPGLFEVPPSHGTPTTPNSTRLVSGASIDRCGNRIKVGIPAKRGISIPDTG